jgi:hypothetical protein
MITVTMQFSSIREMVETLGVKGAEAMIRRDPTVLDKPLEVAAEGMAKDIGEKEVLQLMNDKRAAVKAELDKLGVKYNSRAGTDTLEGILAQAKAAPAAPAAPEPLCKACSDTGKNSKGGDCVCVKRAAPAAPAEPVSPAGMIGLKEVLERAKRFAAMVGGEKGVKEVEAMVATFGVQKISEISAERYPELLRMLTDATTRHSAGGATVLG